MTSCCPTDKTAETSYEHYQRKGQIVQIGDMDMYLVGHGKNAVIMIYDIFGFHVNNYILADRFAANLGITVAIPDIFRGQHWRKEDFPFWTDEKLKEKWGTWIETTAKPVNRVQDVIATKDWLAHNHGCTWFGTIGFCWGAKVGSLVNNSPGFKFHVGPHPSFFNEEDGQNIKVPMLLLPTKTDDMTKFLQGLEANTHPAAKQVQIVEFRDQEHGFMAARGDLKDESVRAGFEEAAKVIETFIQKHF